MSASFGPVLILEDDAAVRDSLRFALEMEGLQVRAYADPVALLNETDMPSQGCLVVDGLPPLLDGIDLARRLRDRDIHLPVILITADASRDARQRAARCGVRLVHGKPVDGDALVASILEALAAPDEGDLRSSP
jgi:two-component system, LuxR family, response regulator FixJ